MTIFSWDNIAIDIMIAASMVMDASHSFIPSPLRTDNPPVKKGQMESCRFVLSF